MYEKIKEKVTKQIKKFGKMIIVSTSSFVLLVSLFFGVINGVFSSASKIFSDIIDNIKIDGNNIVVDENYMKVTAGAEHRPGDCVLYVERPLKGVMG